MLSGCLFHFRRCDILRQWLWCGLEEAETVEDDSVAADNDDEPVVVEEGLMISLCEEMDCWIWVLWCLGDFEICCCKLCVLSSISVWNPEGDSGGVIGFLEKMCSSPGYRDSTLDDLERLPPISLNQLSGWCHSVDEEGRGRRSIDVVEDFLDWLDLDGEIKRECRQLSGLGHLVDGLKE